MLEVVGFINFDLELLILKGIRGDLVGVVLGCIKFIVVCGVCGISRSHFDAGVCVI